MDIVTSPTPSEGEIVASLGAQLTTFTCFPKFPIEIRLEIFKSAMLGRQRLHITFVDEEIQGALRCKEPVPVLLHVCRESREVALKQYQRLFSSLSNVLNIYFNVDLDTLFFGPIAKNDGEWHHYNCREYGRHRGVEALCAFTRSVDPEILDQIRRLAVDAKILKITSEWRIEIELAKFRNLHHFTEWYGDSQLTEYRLRKESYEDKTQFYWADTFKVIKRNSNWKVPQIGVKYVPKDMADEQSSTIDHHCCGQRRVIIIRPSSTLYSLPSTLNPVQRS